MDAKPQQFGERRFGPDDAASHVYLGFVQSIISRMAGNSASVKTWCAAIVAGLLAVSDPALRVYTITACVLVTVAFTVVDAYYLSLERDYRKIYNGLVNDLVEGGIPDSALFRLKIDPDKESGRRLGKTVAAMRSFSIWPFFGVLLLGLSAFVVVLCFGGSVHAGTH